MGALKLSVNPANNVSYQSNFAKYSDGVKLESGTSTSGINLANAYKDGKASSAASAATSFGTEANGLFSSVVNGVVGGSLVASGLNPVIDWIKKKYDDKARELGVGAYAPTSGTAPSSGSTSGTAPSSGTTSGTAPTSGSSPSGSSGLTPSGANENTSLIEVLKTSTNNVGSIAEILLYSNLLVAGKLDKMIEVIVLNGQVEQAYSDINLQMSQTVHDVEVAYKEQNLTNHTELMNKLNEVVSKGVQLDTVKADLNARMTAIDNVNNLLKSDLEHLQNEARSNPELIKYRSDMLAKLGDLGVTIKRSEKEIALTDKKLEHITYERTPIQLDNVGDVIPSATPQEMRAIKNAVVAKKYSDENTFEVDDSDIDDLFDNLQDIDLSSIFDYSKKSTRLTEVLGGVS